MLEGLQRRQALLAEITNDPLGIGYAAMTDTAVAVSLNTPYTAGPEKTSVRGSDIFNAIDPAEWVALSATDQQHVRDVFGLGDSIDVSSGTNTRTVLLTVFTNAAAPNTRTNLAALVQTTISRGEELDLGPVLNTEVFIVRNP